jgi:UDP-glucose 4-epimerase
MSSILVTGGLGFVGSNLVDMLCKDGHDVLVLDDLSSDSSTLENSNPNASYRIGKVEDINTILQGYRFDKIFHLAAQARIQPSFDNPSGYFKSNALGTSELMEFARISKSGIVVYATTSSKNHGSIFITPYTYSKVVGEGILKTYSHCFNQNCAMATFYNVYGPREPKEGEWATVIAKFKRQWENGDQLTVVGDGKQTRDFTHVEDICRGLISISLGEWKGDNFDLGRGEPISILDIAKLWVDGDMSKIKFTPLRKNEGTNTQSDWKNTEMLLGWRAIHNLIDYISVNKNKLNG